MRWIVVVLVPLEVVGLLRLSCCFHHGVVAGQNELKDALAA